MKIDQDRSVLPVWPFKHFLRDKGWFPLGSELINILNIPV